MLNKTFRLFISSTFSDFILERNILNDKIFPVVDDFCQQRGYNFQLVDLRWGVTNESALNQNTLAICLDEVKRCRTLSPRPNFLLMAGERYGWIPLPTNISVKDFEEILTVASAEEKKLLTQWYILDENEIGGQFYLKNRRGEYVKDELWSNTEKAIYSALYNCIVNKLDPDEKKIQEITSSATEKEIFEGLLDYEGISNNTIALFREDYPEKDENQEKIENLKQRIVQKMDKEGCSSNVLTLKWDAGYIKQFEQNIINLLIKNISLEMERLAHEENEINPKEEMNVIFDSAGVVFDRTDEAERLNDYLNSDSEKPLYIYGDSGSGKTTLLAQLVQKSTEQVFFSFYGLGENSYTLLSSVQRIVDDIKACYKIKKDFNVNEFNLSEALFNAVYSIPESEKAIIIIDGFDMFHDTNEMKESVIPAVLPKNVKFIVSSANLGVLHKFFGDELQLYKLDWLDSSKSNEFFNSLLKQKNRCLASASQRDIVAESIKNGATPLQLKLMSEECRTWHSSDEVEAFSDFVDDIAHRHLANMYQKFGHNKELVLYALALISAAPYGIAEEELQALLLRFAPVRKYFISEDRYDYRKEKLPFAVWSRLFYDLKGCLTLSRVKGLIVVKFAHQVFYRVFVNNYEDYYNEARNVLISYYEEQRCYVNDKKMPNVRKALAFAELIKRTDDKQKLFETLSDLTYIDSVIKIGNVNEVITNLQYVLRSVDEKSGSFLKMIYNCIQKNRTMLSCYYGEFWPCINDCLPSDNLSESAVESSGMDNDIFYFPYSLNSKISWSYDGKKYAAFNASYVYICSIDSYDEICRIYLAPKDKKRINVHRVLWLDENVIGVITGENSVVVYDFSDGIPNVIFTYQAENGFFYVEYSRRNKLLFIRDWGKIKAFDIYENQERFIINLGMSAFTTEILGYEINDEYNCLYIRDSKKYIRAFDLSNGELLQKFRVKPDNGSDYTLKHDVHCIAENLFLIYGADFKNRFTVVDTLNKKYLFLHPPVYQEIRGVVIGERYVIFVYSDALVLVDLLNKYEMKCLAIQSINNVSWKTKDEYFSVLSNDGLNVLSVEAFRTFSEYCSVCFPYKKNLFSSVFLAYRGLSRDYGVLRKCLKKLSNLNNIWDYDIFFKANEETPFDEALSTSANIVAMADDGKIAVAYEEKETIIVYNSDKTPLLQIDKLRLAICDNLLKMCFSADSKYLLLWRNDSVQVLDVCSGKMVVDLDVMWRPALDVNFSEGSDSLKLLLCDGVEYCYEFSKGEKSSSNKLPKKLVSDFHMDDYVGPYTFIKNEDGKYESLAYMDYTSFDIESNVNSWFSKKRVYHGKKHWLYYENGEFFLDGDKTKAFSHELFDFRKCYEMQKLQEGKAIKYYLLEKNDLSSTLLEYENCLVLVSRMLGSVIFFDMQSMSVVSAYKTQGNIIGCNADLKNGNIKLILDRPPYNATLSFYL